MQLRAVRQLLQEALAEVTGARLPTAGEAQQLEALGERDDERRRDALA